MIIHYRKDLKNKSRKLRSSMTYGEIKLWAKLRRKQMLGYKFLRQRPVDKYIVDFYAPELKLIIEIDGFSHDIKYEYDKQRENALKNLGFFILRFTEKEIHQNLDEVLTTIEHWINENA